MGQDTPCSEWPYDAVIHEARTRIRRRYRRGRRIMDAGAVAQYALLHLQNPSQEVFAVLFLDSRHAVISFEELFFGSIDRAQVYPRRVLERSLLNAAAAVVFMHNHPSGNPEPSASDVQLTERLKRLLAEIDVRVLDHIVVGGDKTVSLAERGVL